MNYKKIAVLITLAGFILPAALAEDKQEIREHKIKAAFLYNFLNFVEWPKEALTEEDGSIVVGVLGKETSGRLLSVIANKTVKDKKIDVRQFEDFCDSAQRLKNKKSSEKWYKALEALKKCHVVFITDCRSISNEDMTLILKEIKDSPILTVGERQGFIDKGGVINFITDKKVYFEINLESADKSKLKIRSKLAKLAKRVIKRKDEQGGSK